MSKGVKDAIPKEKGHPEGRPSPLWRNATTPFRIGLADQFLCKHSLRSNAHP